MVSSATISRWLKTVLYLSGIDVSKFKPHSVYGAAASKTKTSGVPIQDILKVAGWASAITFAECFERPVKVDSEKEFQQ